MSQTKETLARFVADAPPGEVSHVRDSIAAIVDNAQLVAGLDGAVAQYHETNFSVVTVSGRPALVTPFNKVADATYVSQGTQFDYNADTGRAENVQPSNETGGSDHTSLVSSLQTYVDQHYPSQVGVGVYTQANGDVVVAIADHKFSPSNYWNGRWKSWYVLSASESQAQVDVDVHYYEDGNVRLKAGRGPERLAITKTSSASEIVRAIGQFETAYETELNRAFVGLNEGSFKSLRRQLPVTRAKMNWGKSIGNYRLGKDIAGE